MTGSWLSTRLLTTGNGAAEMRDWVEVHGVAGSQGFEVIDDCPSPETLVGAGFGSWWLA